MAATAKRKKRLNGDLWSVDCIVDEKLAWGTGSWYRVRWLGYHPTWERYERAEGGQPGQLPFETWEPHSALVWGRRRCNSGKIAQSSDGQVDVAADSCSWRGSGDDGIGVNA